jgi:hypothetical protein
MGKIIKTAVFIFSVRMVLFECYRIGKEEQKRIKKEGNEY